MTSKENLVVRETRHNLRIMTGVILLSAIIALGLSIILGETEFSKILQMASITLIFGALFGGFVKLLMDDFDRGRQQRAEQAQFCLNILSELKAVYDQTERARVLISGNRSAKTYYEQMILLIEARVKLVNVDRAVNIQSITPTAGNGDSFFKGIAQNVSSMSAYLETLLRDYQQEYKDISEKQRAYEARMKFYVDKLAGNQPPAEGQPDNLPWAAICELESMKDFLDLSKLGAGKTLYEQQFVTPLDHASALLIHQLRRVLG